MLAQIEGFINDSNKEISRHGSPLKERSPM